MASKKKTPASPAKDKTADASSGGGPGILSMVLIPVVSVAALVAGMAAAMGIDGLKGLIASSEAGPGEEHAMKTEDSGGHGVSAGGHDSGQSGSSSMDYSVLDFEEMILNIGGFTASGDRTTRFMKISLSLVYDNDADGLDRVIDHEPFMRDAFQDYLRQLTERDLEGSIGLVRLREELVRRAQAIVGTSAPREILIGDLIIQ